MKKELLQCPYEPQCKCDMEESCVGCETWAIAMREKKEKEEKEQTKLIQRVLKTIFK